MPLGRTVGWWSPDPRAILPLTRLQISRSLRRSCQRFQIKINTSFDSVVEQCASPGRPNGWIDDDIRNAYSQLHALGWAHSIETWLNGELVGGLYGVAIGSFFAGESMFHRENDASKVALVALVDAMKTTGGALLDVQWQTPHLEGLGAIEIGRAEYLELLDASIVQPLAAIWSQPMTFKPRSSN